MALKKEEIRNIAKLARIQLDEQQIGHFTQELNQILDWVAMLAEVDTKGVVEMTSVEVLALPMRKDEVTDGNIQDQILANAPVHAYDCFVVPKVVE